MYFYQHPIIFDHRLVDFPELEDICRAIRGLDNCFHKYSSRIALLRPRLLPFPHSQPDAEKLAGLFGVLLGEVADLGKEPGLLLKFSALLRGEAGKECVGCDLALAPGLAAGGGGFARWGRFGHGATR